MGNLLDGKGLIEGLGGTVRVHSLFLDQMSINSVLVILSVSLFAISQLLTLTKSIKSQCDNRQNRLYGY